MAYDPNLADGIRELLADESDVTEKKMFGGIGFLVGGNLAVAASSKGGLMVRVDPEDSPRLTKAAGVELVVMRGRQMPGWLRVDGANVSRRRELARWVTTGTKYARSLPPKR